MVQIHQAINSYPLYIHVLFISELFELLPSAPSAQGTAEGKVRILQHRHFLCQRWCPVTDSHYIKPYHKISQTLAMLQLPCADISGSGIKENDNSLVL